MIKHILLDLDGVLVDWSGAVCALFGKPDLEITSWDTHTFLGVPEEEMWAAIDDAGPEFWYNLPHYPWFEELLNLVYGYPWTLCSCPSLDPFSALGKRLWIRRTFGPDFTSYMLGKEKHLMSKPGVVLIDDSDKNVRIFQHHGGHAILFPQPWNQNREIARTGKHIDYVRARLYQIRDGLAA